jgi:hypothetical protein
MRPAMSMKRSKAKSTAGRPGDADESSYFAKPKEPEKTWAEHMEGKGDDAFLPYAMSTRYGKGQLVSHSKFGKGVVIHADAQRIEVLFEDGPKKLGHAA